MFYFQHIFFLNYAFYEIYVEKYGRAGQSTRDNMAQAPCVLDT